MPWKESDAMDERLQFVTDALSDRFTMTELCERYGVSRRIGYKWHPLLLECHRLLSTETATARPIFEHVFREYGLPGAIRTDNGVPFGRMTR